MVSKLQLLNQLNLLNSFTTLGNNGPILLPVTMNALNIIGLVVTRSDIRNLSYNELVEALDASKYLMADKKLVIEVLVSHLVMKVTNDAVNKYMA